MLGCSPPGQSIRSSTRQHPSPERDPIRPRQKSLVLIKPETRAQALTDVQRAALERAWEADSRPPSLASRRAWADAQNIEQAVVHSWFSHKRYHAVHRRGEVLQTGTYDLDVDENVHRHAPKDVRVARVLKVKRERAVSPSLLNPLPKKARISSAHVAPQDVTIPLVPVRHTRAHENAPHPACLTCYPFQPCPSVGVCGSSLSEPNAPMDMHADIHGETDAPSTPLLGSSSPLLSSPPDFDFDLESNLKYDAASAMSSDTILALSPSPPTSPSQPTHVYAPHERKGKGRNGSTLRSALIQHGRRGPRTRNRVRFVLDLLDARRDDGGAGIDTTISPPVRRTSGFSPSSYIEFELHDSPTSSLRVSSSGSPVSSKSDSSAPGNIDNLSSGESAILIQASFMGECGRDIDATGSDTGAMAMSGSGLDSYSGSDSHFGSHFGCSSGGGCYSGDQHNDDMQSTSMLLSELRDLHFPCSDARDDERAEGGEVYYMDEDPADATMDVVENITAPDANEIFEGDNKGTCLTEQEFHNKESVAYTEREDAYTMAEIGLTVSMDAQPAGMPDLAATALYLARDNTLALSDSDSSSGDYVGGRSTDGSGSGSGSVGFIRAAPSPAFSAGVVSTISHAADSAGSYTAISAAETSANNATAADATATPGSSDHATSPGSGSFNVLSLAYPGKNQAGIISPVDAAQALLVFASSNASQFKPVPIISSAPSALSDIAVEPVPTISLTATVTQVSDTSAVGEDNTEVPPQNATLPRTCPPCGRSLTGSVRPSDGNGKENIGRGGNTKSREKRAVAGVEGPTTHRAQMLGGDGDGAPLSQLSLNGMDLKREMFDTEERLRDGIDGVDSAKARKPALNPKVRRKQNKPGVATLAISSGRETKENERQTAEGQEVRASKWLAERPSKTLQRRPKPTGAGSYHLPVSNLPVGDSPEEVHIVPLAKQLTATRQSERLRKKLVKESAPLTSLTTDLTQRCVVNRKGSQTSTVTYDGISQPTLWFPPQISSIDSPNWPDAHLPHTNVGQGASGTSPDDFPGLALPKCPPRPYAYEPLALKAFEDMTWDQAGFENMELSAIGWLASIGCDVVRPIVDMSCSGMENVPVAFAQVLTPPTSGYVKPCAHIYADITPSGWLEELLHVSQSAKVEWTSRQSVDSGVPDEGPCRA